MPAAVGALLGGEQPPAARLAAVAQLELDADGRERGDGVVVAAGAPSPAMQREQLGLAAAARPSTTASVVRGLAPGDELLVDEADGVAAPEAALGRRRAPPAATPPVRTRCSASCIAAAFVAAPASGSSATRGRQPRLHASGWARPCTLFSESSAARSAAMKTLGQFGRTTTSSARDVVDAGEQLVGRGVQRRAAVEHGARRGPRRARACPSPETTASAPQHCGRRLAPQARVRALLRPARACRRRRGARPSPAPRTAPWPAPGRRCGRGPSASSRSPTTSTESPSCLEPCDELRRGRGPRR